MENPEKVEVTEDIRQSPEYGRFMEKIGWKTVHPGGVQMFVRKLGPVGIAKMQRARLPQSWKEIDKVVRNERVFMLKIEPNDVGRLPEDYKQDAWPLLGTKTLRINLRLSEDEVMARFKKDCRYSIRQVMSGKPQIALNEFDRFYEIWRKSANRKNLWIPSFENYQGLIESFGNKCFGVTIDDAAGAVILMHKETAFYYYAGATKDGNRLNLPYLVVWEAMREAKRRGCRVWDFEGVFDERWPNKGWRGFSHFKKEFGGVEVEYPGCFVKWRLPL